MRAHPRLLRLGGRLLEAAITLWLLGTLCFVLLRAAPGGPFDTEKAAPPEVQAVLDAQYRLDQSLPMQYLGWLGDALRGDLGPSFQYPDYTVNQLIANALPVSALNGGLALLLALLCGVALGAWAALRAGGWSDRALMFLAGLGLAIPKFVVAPLLVLLFAVTLHWLPAGGWGEWDNVVLPVIALALPNIAYCARLTRASLLDTLSADYLRAARARGLRVSAHLPFVLPVDEVSKAGLSSIEHIEYAYKAGSSQEAQISAMVRRGEIDSREGWNRSQASFDRKTALAAYRRLAQRGTAVTPTLNGSFVTTYLDRDDHKNDPYLQYIGPGLQATYAWRVERAAKDDAAAIVRRHERYQRNASILPLLQQAGVNILAGTDAGFLNSFNYPGVGLHDEMQRFVESGLTPLQTLQAATINGARFLGQDKEHGSLAAGKAADIVLLDADPLRDIGATRKIDTFVLRGQVHDRAALDAMLAQVRGEVAAQRAADEAAKAADAAKAEPAAAKR